MVNAITHFLPLRQGESRSPLIRYTLLYIYTYIQVTC